MDQQDIRALSHFSKALWVDEGISRRAAVETLTAVSLMDLAPERALESASAALLERASRDGGSVNVASLHEPFFRLMPSERFLLVALHLERWSYDRVGRVLKKTPEAVAEAAWRLRIHLISQKQGARIATGGAPKTASCPEFDARNPWTQRFLDDEFDHRQRLFVQNHLMACDSCRAHLNRCRDLYFQVDSLLPRISPESIEQLQATYRKNRAYVRPMERTARDTFRLFIQRTDVQWAMALGLALIALQLFKLF